MTVTLGSNAQKTVTGGKLGFDIHGRVAPHLEWIPTGAGLAAQIGDKIPGAPAALYS